MKQQALLNGMALVVTKDAVIAGLKNPPLKQVEIFPRKVYRNPKDNDIVRTVGAVSSCGQ